MKSITKSKVMPEEIKRIFARHFPNAAISKITKLTDGMFNSAYLIDGTEALQTNVVLKVGPRPDTEILTYEKDIIQVKLTAYNRLATKLIPTPQVLVSDSSHDIIDCDYFIMSFLPGNTWKNQQKKIPTQAIPELKRELGRYFASMHSVQGEWFGYIKDDKRYQFDSWSAAFCAMITDILTDGRKHKKKLPYNEIESALERHRNLLDEITSPFLVSFDVWAGNVFVDKNPLWHISGIVDFERAFYGDPMADFVAAVMLFNDVENEIDLQKGYSEMSERPFIITENDRIRMRLYRLYLYTIMHVETYRYNKIYALGIEQYAMGTIKKLLSDLR